MSGLPAPGGARRGAPAFGGPGIQDDGGGGKSSLSGAPSLFGGGGSGGGGGGGGESSASGSGLTSLGPGFGKKANTVSLADNDDLDALFADKPMPAQDTKSKKKKGMTMDKDKKKKASKNTVMSISSDLDIESPPRARGIAAAQRERAEAAGEDLYSQGAGGGEDLYSQGGGGGAQSPGLRTSGGSTKKDSPTSRLRQFLMEDDKAPEVGGLDSLDDDLDIFGTGKGGGLSAGRRSAGRRAGSAEDMSAAGGPGLRARAAFGGDDDDAPAPKPLSKSAGDGLSSFGYRGGGSIADSVSNVSDVEELPLPPSKGSSPPGSYKASSGPPMPYAQPKPAAAAAPPKKSGDDWGDSGDILDMLPDAGGKDGGGGGGGAAPKGSAIAEEDSDPSLDMGGYRPSFMPSKSEARRGSIGSTAGDGAAAETRPRRSLGPGTGADALRKSAPGTLGSGGLGGPVPSSTPTAMSRDERRQKKRHGLLDDALRHSSSLDMDDPNDSSTMSMEFGVSAEKRKQRREERQKARESSQTEAEAALQGAISRSASFDENRRSSEKPPLAASPAQRRAGGTAKPGVGGGLADSTRLDANIDLATLRRRYEADTGELKEEVKRLSKMVARSAASGGGGSLSPTAGGGGGGQNEALIARLRDQVATKSHEADRARAEAKAAADRVRSDLHAKDEEIASLGRRLEDRAGDNLRRDAGHQEDLRRLRDEADAARKEADESRRAAAQARLEADSRAEQITAGSGELERVRAEAAAREEALKREAHAARDATAASADELREQVLGLGSVRKAQEEELRKHADAVEEMRRANGSHLEQMTEEHRAAAARLAEQHRREVEQVEALHREAMAAKDRVVQEERDMMLRHHSSAELLSELTRRVDASQKVAQELQASLASDRERTLRDRGDRMDKYESHMSAREDAMARRERETEGLRLQLENLLGTLDTSTREARAGMADEKLRLLREHARLEALQEALVGERAAVREQVEAERRRLNEAREARAAEREVFMQECLDETRKLAAEREELAARKERSAKEAEEARERVLELERQAVVEAGRLEAQQHQRQAARAQQEAERAELERHVAGLRQDKDRFQEEIQRLTALGIHMQAKSEEVMHAAEANEVEAKGLGQRQAEVALEKKKMWAEGRKLEDERRALGEAKRNFDRSRVSMAQERQQLQEERVAASRAAEAARVLQLQLSDQMRRWAEQGFSLDDPAAPDDGDEGVARRAAQRRAARGKGNKQRGSSKSSALSSALKELGLDGDKQPSGKQRGGGGGGAASSYLESQAAFLDNLRASLWGSPEASGPLSAHGGGGGGRAGAGFSTYPTGPGAYPAGGEATPSQASSMDRGVYAVAGGGNTSLSFTPLFPVSSNTSYADQTGGTTMMTSPGGDKGGGAGAGGMSSTDFSEVLGGMDSSPPSSGSEGGGGTNTPAMAAN